MPGKFERKLFSEIDLNDSFFDSLKHDYPEFIDWFRKKAIDGRDALIFSDELGLGAFISLKPENEELPLKKLTVPMSPRLKISTLYLAERFRGQRLGEGAMGLILWEWQRSRLDEIYATVFPDHDDVIQQFERFGFALLGHNDRGECVYMRNRENVDYSDPYKSFPFISPSFKKGGYLIVEDAYHDTLFPYSELKNTLQEQLEIDAANGVSKAYIGNQWQTHYNVGEPVFIYRKYNGPRGKRFKSCLTSFCVVTGVIAVTRRKRHLITFEQFCQAISNKSVFSKSELKNKYDNDPNLTVVQLLYYGYFGSGNNVNMDWLATNGLWSPEGSNIYPANIELTPRQCATILRAGEVDISNVILN